jgi:hypothetical protein
MRCANCFVLAICVSSFGCNSPPCTAGQTRCVGNSAQICLSNGQWREFENCSDVGQHSGGTWQCGSSSVDGGVSCVGGGFCEAKDPTPEMVRAFWSFMESVYGSKQIDKHDAPSMELLADVLQLLHIQDEDTFLNKFTTTIGTHIYTPFDLGVQTPDYPLWGQIVICVHEHQHVNQYRAEGLDYLTDYIGSSSERAEFEAEAYRTAAELDWWRYRSIDSAQLLANHIEPYNVTPGDVDVARSMIQISEETIRNGGLVSDIATTAIEWLEANAPGLKVHS